MPGFDQQGPRREGPLGKKGRGMSNGMGNTEAGTGRKQGPCGQGLRKGRGGRGRGMGDGQGGGKRQGNRG